MKKNTSMTGLSGTAHVDTRLTAVESWLLDLGLRAIEVDRCPIADCALCAVTTAAPAPARSRRAA